MNDARLGLERAVRGRTGEQVAASFLTERGYLVMAKNQRTPLGELDLVCRTSSHVVVVEVKARSGDEYGSGLEAIGPRKARRLRAAAVWWLSAFPAAFSTSKTYWATGPADVCRRGLGVRLGGNRSGPGAGRSACP